MLDPATWLTQAQELALGQRRRVDHDCGAGRTLLVEHKPEGFAAWCHRCSDKGWHPHPRPSLAERIARLNAVRAEETAAQAVKAPPAPTEWNPSLWPLHARVWLYKAGFSNEAITAHGWYYTDRLDRVVLPIYRDGKVLYWQARGFSKDRPKYLNPPIDKPLAFYGGGPLVLCEDVLSAARVGEVARGCAVLGTSLSDRGLAEVLRERAGAPVALWLDPDAAGRKGAARISQALQLAGADVRVIRSDLDPKLYPAHIIKEFIYQS